MRFSITIAVTLFLAAACSEKKDAPPTVAKSPVEATAKPAPASTERVQPPDPPAAAEPAPTAAGTTVVNLATIKDNLGNTEMLNATIELPAENLLGVTVETKTVDGALYSVARVSLGQIEISPEHAEMTSADIEIDELPASVAFEEVKASFKPTDIVRADKDSDGHTFVTKVGDDFRVTVRRGTLLCSSDGPDDGGILEVAVPVVVRACQSLRPGR